MKISKENRLVVFLKYGKCVIKINEIMGRKNEDLEKEIEEKRQGIKKRNKRLQIMWAILYTIFILIISYSFYTWIWYAGLITFIIFIIFAAVNYGWINIK